MKKNESDIWTRRYFPEGTCLESTMLTKDEIHFLWKIVLGCLSLKKNLWTRRIQCDTQCAWCGAAWKLTNHVYFDCPPVGSFTNTIEPSYFFQLHRFLQFHRFLQIWIFVLVSGSANEKTSICLDYMVHLERTIFNLLISFRHNQNLF